MKRIEALRLAERIGSVIASFPRQHEIITAYNKIVDRSCDNPENNGLRWHEILIFGSTVRKCDDEKVGDLDMMIIDNGVVSSQYEHIIQNEEDEEDWYFGLKSNLNRLLESEEKSYNKGLQSLLADLEEKRPSIDLHILPLKLFKDKEFRMEVLSKHKDPNFFKNCFSSIMRLRNGKQFVPVDVSYFEYKYKCRLQDIKR